MCDGCAPFLNKNIFMFKSMKLTLKKRKLKKEIQQSSFNCSSMEMASDKEWQDLGFGDKYETERKKLDNLRIKLNRLT